MHYLIGFLIGGISCGSVAAVGMYLHFQQVNSAVNQAQSAAVSSLQSAHGKLDKILSILHV